MSKVVSVRLKDDQYTRLQRAARALGRTPSESVIVFVEEALREREFAFIEFRETAVGRDAFIRGTRLKVWQIVSFLQDCEGDIQKVADLLEIPIIQVKAAMNYAAAFPEEIDAAIADNSPSIVELQRLLPNLEIFDVNASPA
jgi:uncharacterized protein (DUF433 family)